MMEFEACTVLSLGTIQRLYHDICLDEQKKSPTVQ